MHSVRLGIIGVGNMGSAHARTVLEGKVTRCELTAVCDIVPARLEPFSAIQSYRSHAGLLRSGRVDAVLVATPHFAHVPVGVAALKRGLHVLVEKPIAVHKADCEKLLAAHTNPRQVFAVMFNQRTDPYFRKIREMVQGGELGEIRRINWTITNWFRTAAYYASGGWRATWAGEGGGVLLNQCPHNLDLFQWMFGRPERLRAYCQFGRYHAIEVEDDVTAYCEFANGATAVFITSTGEAPGTNRLEVVGENGRLVYETDRLTFWRNEVPMTEFNRATDKPFSVPACTEIPIPVAGHGGQHVEVLQNFVDAILDGTPLLAPARDGIHSVELANAMLLSSLKDRTVTLPLDSRAYARLLRSLVKNSRQPKPFSTPGNVSDLTGSVKS